MPNQITWYAHKLNKTVESFKYVFDKALENLIIDRMEQNEDIFVRFMNDKEFQIYFSRCMNRLTLRNLFPVKNEVSYASRSINMESG